MTPPIWLDEACRPCPTYPCPICGRETPLYRLHGRPLFHQRGPALFGSPASDWRPFQIERHPSWCGHPVPRVYLPIGGGWWQWQEVLVYEEQEPGEERGG
jgi:hypothetical protein